MSNLSKSSRSRGEDLISNIIFEKAGNSKYHHAAEIFNVPKSTLYNDFMDANIN